MFRAATFKGGKVYAEVNKVNQNQLLVNNGKVNIRYKNEPGAKEYSASASGVALGSQGSSDANASPASTAGEKKHSMPPAAKRQKTASGAVAVRHFSTNSQSNASGSASVNGEHAENANQLLQTFSPDSVICFTDGACQGNPGPCGAGAVVVLPSKQANAPWLERHSALGQGTNNIGELTAIGLALGMLQELESGALQPPQPSQSQSRHQSDSKSSHSHSHSHSHSRSEDNGVLEEPDYGSEPDFWKCLHCLHRNAGGQQCENEVCGAARPAQKQPESSAVKQSANAQDTDSKHPDADNNASGSSNAGLKLAGPVEILTDSKYAQGVLCLNWKAKKNQQLITELKAKLAERSRTHRVRIHWVKGHAGIAGNERADQLATLGVSESRSGAVGGAGSKRKGAWEQ